MQEVMEEKEREKYLGRHQRKEGREPHGGLTGSIRGINAHPMGRIPNILPTF